MATLPGLNKGVVKDPTPPATDTIISPITIPNGTILVTTKTTNETIDNVNQLIDYISGDAANFIPKSAIVDGAEVFTWDGNHDANGNNFLLSGGLIQFADTQTTISQIGMNLHSKVDVGGRFVYSVDSIDQFTITDSDLRLHGNILRLQGGHVEFASSSETISQIGDDMHLGVGISGIIEFRINNSSMFHVSGTGANGEGNKIVNVADPTNSQDVVTKAYGDANYLDGGEFFGPYTNTHDVGNQILDNVGLLILNEDIQMINNKSIIWESNRIIRNTTDGFFFQIETGDFFKYQINAIDEYVFDELQADFKGNNIVNVPKIEFEFGLQILNSIGSDAIISFDHPNAENLTFALQGGDFIRLNNTSQSIQFFNQLDLNNFRITNVLEILNMGDITFANGKNLIIAGATGMKIGTAITQKIGFWNATPIIQPTHIADPAGGATVDAEARTAINSILSQLASMGLQASI